MNSPPLSKRTERTTAINIVYYNGFGGNVTLQLKDLVTGVRHVAAVTRRVVGRHTYRAYGARSCSMSRLTPPLHSRLKDVVRAPHHPPIVTRAVTRSGGLHSYWSSFLQVSGRIKENESFSQSASFMQTTRRKTRPVESKQKNTVLTVLLNPC